MAASNYGNQHRSGGGSQGNHPPSQPVPLDKIRLESPSEALFDTIADESAKAVSDNGGKDKNKPTQLRKFYDEVCMWDQRIRQKPDSFNENLPLIRMLNAKIAYAEGRSLVDKSFYDLIRHCLQQVTSKETFWNFKLFFEAFMGFYKMHKPK